MILFVGPWQINEGKNQCLFRGNGGMQNEWRLLVHGEMYGNHRHGIPSNDEVFARQHSFVMVVTFDVT